MPDPTAGAPAARHAPARLRGPHVVLARRCLPQHIPLYFWDPRISEKINGCQKLILNCLECSKAEENLVKGRHDEFKKKRKVVISTYFGAFPKKGKDAP